MCVSGSLKDKSTYPCCRSRTPAVAQYYDTHGLRANIDSVRRSAFLKPTAQVSLAHHAIGRPLHTQLSATSVAGSVRADAAPLLIIVLQLGLVRLV